MNRIHEAGRIGRWCFHTLRRLAQFRWPASANIADVERFALRWRLYRRGNWSDARLLLCPDAFEPTEFESIANCLNPGFTFVDVGANCGFYALRIADALARTASGTGTVVAIEPHPELRRRLAFNVQLNPGVPVRLLGVAVGDCNGAARLLDGGRNLGRTRLSDKGSIEVEVRTLLDIVLSEELERLDAVKVDVEGHEDRVLGPYLRDAPARLLPRVVVAEHSGHNAWRHDWLSRAKARGYRETARTPSGNLVLVRS